MNLTIEEYQRRNKQIDDLYQAGDTRTLYELAGNYLNFFYITQKKQMNDHLQELADKVGALNEQESGLFATLLAAHGKHIQPLEDGDSPLKQCLRANAGKCGTCNTDGSFTPCGG